MLKSARLCTILSILRARRRDIEASGLHLPPPLKIEGFWFGFQSLYSNISTNFPKNTKSIGGGGKVEKNRPTVFRGESVIKVTR